MPTTSAPVVMPIRTVTATPATATTDDFTLLVDTDTIAGAAAVTLPDPATVEGRMFVVKRLGAYDVTITPADGLIEGAASLTLIADRQAVRVQSDGTNYNAIGQVAVSFS